jgi:hypothetical protein
MGTVGISFTIAVPTIFIFFALHQCFNGTCSGGDWDGTEATSHSITTGTTAATGNTAAALNPNRLPAYDPEIAFPHNTATTSTTGSTANSAVYPTTCFEDQPSTRQTATNIQQLQRPSVHTSSSGTIHSTAVVRETTPPPTTTTVPSSTHNDNTMFHPTNDGTVTVVSLYDTPMGPTEI